MKSLSIRLRLTVWYTAVLSLALILFSVALRYSLARQLRRDLDDSLRNQAHGLEEYLQIEEQDNAPNLAHEIDEYSRSMPSDHLLAAYNLAGQPVYVSTLGLNQLADRGERQRSTWRIRWMNRSYLATVHKIPLREGAFTVFLAISSEPIEHALERLNMLLAVIVPGFLAAGALGGYWLSRRALSPVQRITEKARSIGVNNLSERLAVPETRDEIQHLAETWNDMLERLESAVAKISQFTADASHELRTPIAIIRFAAERALRRSRTEAEYQETLLQIQNESERMTGLIEDLLYLARADSGAHLIEKNEIDLAELVRTTCSDFEPLASAKRIALEQTVPDESVAVLGSDSALRRMLRILLDNAIKYTPAGGSVSVRLQRENGQVLLAVSDTGIGIPEQSQLRIFQRFFRADPSRNKESGGYGLGLSIARTIAHQHSASIQMQSKAGSGSTFSIAIPIEA
jgi:two-component system, OmpR family, heavy metal sensor histidine kinase CusS